MYEIKILDAVYKILGFALNSKLHLKNTEKKGQARAPTSAAGESLILIFLRLCSFKEQEVVVHTNFKFALL